MLTGNHFEPFFVFQQKVCRSDPQSQNLRKSPQNHHTQNPIDIYISLSIMSMQKIYHICSCPCTNSHLEPLCIHRHIHKYTCIILYILFVQQPKLCKLTNACALANAHYIYRMIDSFVYKPMLCKLTYVCALRVLTLRTSLFTYSYTYKYTFRIQYILLYIPPCCANSRMSLRL